MQGLAQRTSAIGLDSDLKPCCVKLSFHKVSRKYLPLYVAEFQFRYNNRTKAKSGLRQK
jgi:hypothetical protein